MFDAPKRANTVHEPSTLSLALKMLGCPFSIRRR